MSASSKRWIRTLVVLAVLALSLTAHAQDGPDMEVTGDTILVGASMPLSGSGAVFGIYSKGVQAYFNYINDNGGVRGKQLKLKLYDDADDPSRTMRNVRRLVENDNVFAVGFIVGTAHNLGVRSYLNNRNIPHILANSGHDEFGNPVSSKKYPLTTVFLPSYALESSVAARYLIEHKPKCKVAILRQNDDQGKSLLEGFRKAIEGTDIEIVAIQVFGLGDPSVLGAVQVLAQSGADVFLNYSSGTYTTQAISKMAELDWRPLTFLISWNVALSTLEPAGLHNAKGFMAAAYLKTPTDPMWNDDEGMKWYRQTVEKYLPGTDPNQQGVAYGFTEAEIFVTALKKAEKLTRSALITSLRNLKDEKMTLLVPGITASTDESQDQYWVINSLALRRFDGEGWKDTGDVYTW